jgi:hypothetical protein
VYVEIDYVRGYSFFRCFLRLMLSSRPQTNTTTLFVEEKNYVENTHTRTVYIRNPWNPIVLDNEHKRWKIVGAWGYYRL